MKNLKLIIEEKYSGRIGYSCLGIRHRDEEETFYLEKGDKVYIEQHPNNVMKPCPVCKGKGSNPRKLYPKSPWGRLTNSDTVSCRKCRGVGEVKAYKTKGG